MCVHLQRRRARSCPRRPSLFVPRGCVQCDCTACDAWHAAAHTCDMGPASRITQSCAHRRKLPNSMMHTRAHKRVHTRAHTRAHTATSLGMHPLCCCLTRRRVSFAKGDAVRIEPRTQSCARERGTAARTRLHDMPAGATTRQCSRTLQLVQTRGPRRHAHMVGMHRAAQYWTRPHLAHAARCRGHACAH